MQRHSFSGRCQFFALRSKGRDLSMQSCFFAGDQNMPFRSNPSNSKLKLDALAQNRAKQRKYVVRKTRLLLRNGRARRLQPRASRDNINAMIYVHPKRDFERQSTKQVAGQTQFQKISSEVLGPKTSQNHLQPEDGVFKARTKDAIRRVNLNESQCMLLSSSQLEAWCTLFRA